jgi:hypothetical protein
MAGQGRGQMRLRDEHARAGIFDHPRQPFLGSSGR